MAKIIFILGLCASGKTYQAKIITEQAHAYLLDEGFNPDQGDLFHQNYCKILQKLQSGINCVVVEIGLCNPKVRNTLLNKLQRDAPNTEVGWICIENDLEQANKNVAIRAQNGGKADVAGHIDINRTVSPVYTYPSGATVIPVYRPT